MMNIHNFGLIIMYNEIVRYKFVIFVRIKVNYICYVLGCDIIRLCLSNDLLVIIIIRTKTYNFY